MNQQCGANVLGESQHDCGRDKSAGNQMMSDAKAKGKHGLDRRSALTNVRPIRTSWPLSLALLRHI